MCCIEIRVVLKFVKPRLFSTKLIWKSNLDQSYNFFKNQYNLYIFLTLLIIITRIEKDLWLGYP